MTRFWITIEQGVEFVIKCVEIMKGGEIFVPKIPSMKIIDLADAIAPKAKKKVIGIRPGEKIHEILLTADEARHTREFDNFFVIEPEYIYWLSEPRVKTKKQGKTLPEGFSYTSDKNTQWLTKEELKKIIKKLSK